MLKTPLSQTADQKKFFKFRIGRLFFSRYSTLSSKTGYRRIRNTRLFVLSTITKDFAAGYEQCKADVLSEIHLTQDATAKHKPKTWDSGFEAALEFLARKVAEQKPKA